MDRPDWVPAAAWARLRAALKAQPAHSADALADLAAVVADWDGGARARLLERFTLRAERGEALPAAFLSSLCDLMEGDG